MKLEQGIRYYIAQTLGQTLSVYISPELEDKAKKLFNILPDYPIGYIVKDLMYGRQLSIYLKQKF